MVLEDDELDSTEAEDEAEAASGDVDVSSVKRDAIEPSGPERWYDVEAGCYIDDEVPPSPGLGEQDGLTFTPAQDRAHSLYNSSCLSQDQINDDDRIT